jgi:hypothetical protein
MAKLEGFFSIRRQREVIREHLIFSTFPFRDSFPHLLSALRNLFCAILKLFKVIDECTTVNKDR